MAAPLHSISADVTAFAAESAAAFEAKKSAGGILAEKAEKVDVVRRKIVEQLYEHSTPASRANSSQLFSGFVKMIVFVGPPASIGSAFSAREGCSNEDLVKHLMDWKTRGLAFIQQFLAAASDSEVSDLLDNADVVQIIFTPTDRKHTAHVLMMTASGVTNKDF